MLLRDDGKEVARASLIVQCPVEIPEAASRVHGYDRETTLRLGVTSTSACCLFVDMAHNADLIIAHNAGFDHLIMHAVIARHGWAMPKTPWFCTMLAAKPHCKIPATPAQLRAGYAKPGDYKQPRLEEALKILLGEDLEGAHDAMADVLGCVRLADWLEAGGHMPRHEAA
jgi:DNA polymerase-3 subunit epsilon